MLLLTPIYIYEECKNCNGQGWFATLILDSGAMLQDAKVLDTHLAQSCLVF